MPDEPITPGIDRETGRIRFDYIKGNYFRVIHVDGVYGGNSPRGGHIQMAVWNERWPIPKQTVHQFEQGKPLGKEILDERVARDAIVREVEVQLMMDIAMAKRMRDWLDDKIQHVEETIEEAEKEEKQ